MEKWICILILFYMLNRIRTLMSKKTGMEVKEYINKTAGKDSTMCLIGLFLLFYGHSLLCMLSMLIVVGYYVMIQIVYSKQSKKVEETKSIPL